MKAIPGQTAVRKLPGIYGLIRSFTPEQQVYFVVAVTLILQYTLNALVYFELLPDVFGKSLNGIFKNSAYLIPGTMAVLATLFFSGKSDLVRLVRPYTVIPINPLWWVLSSGSLILVLWASLYLNDVLYQNDFVVYAITFPSWGEIKTYSPLFIQVALSDELFWIGFVYPRLLQSGYSPLKASLIMGVLWGIEYFPFIFTEFFIAPGLSGSSLVLGWFALIPMYVWLYHKTGSAVIIVFFNLCMQFTYSALPVLPEAVGDNDNSVVAMANLLTLVVGVVLWWLFPKGKKKGLE